MIAKVPKRIEVAEADRRLQSDPVAGFSGRRFGSKVARQCAMICGGSGKKDRREPESTEVGVRIRALTAQKILASDAKNFLKLFRTADVFTVLSELN